MEIGPWVVSRHVCATWRVCLCVCPMSYVSHCVCLIVCVSLCVSTVIRVCPSEGASPGPAHARACPQGGANSLVFAGISASAPCLVLFSVFGGPCMMHPLYACRPFSSPSWTRVPARTPCCESHGTVIGGEIVDNCAPSFEKWSTTPCLQIPPGADEGCSICPLYPPSAGTRHVYGASYYYFC